MAFGTCHDISNNSLEIESLGAPIVAQAAKETVPLRVCNSAGDTLWSSDHFDVDTSFRDLRDMVGHAVALPGECSKLVHDTGEVDLDSSLKLLGAKFDAEIVMLTFVKDGETEEITATRPPSAKDEWQQEIDAEQDTTTYSSGIYRLLEYMQVHSSLHGDRELLKLREGSTIRILAFARDDSQSLIRGFIHEPVHGWISVADAVYHKCWAILEGYSVEYEVLSDEDTPGMYEVLDDVIVTEGTALCVSEWYYAQNDPNSRFFKTDEDRVCFRVIFCFLQVVVQHHSGSCAFGSLLVGLCWLANIMLRVVSKSVTQTAKTGKAIAGTEAGGVDAAPSSSSSCSSCFSCLKCCSLERCVGCLTYVMTYISSKAYVFIAVEGGHFCKSAVHVGKLVLHYPAQMAANTFLNNLLYFLICVLVLASVFTFAFLVHNELFQEEGFCVPGVCAILALILMNSMVGMYATAVDALFVCIYRDLQKFDGKYLKQCPQLFE